MKGELPTAPSIACLWYMYVEIPVQLTLAMDTETAQDGGMHGRDYLCLPHVTSSHTFGLRVANL